MKNPFRRKNKQTIAEIENYYAGQSSGKGRSGMAWLMAIISLLITLIIIALLFFGIRWIYRTLVDDSADQTDTVATGQVSEAEAEQASGSDSDSEGSQSSSDVLNEELAGNDSESEGTVSDEAASTTRDTAGDSTTSSTSTPTTGGSEPLPNTGPGEVLLFVPAATVAVGYIISRKRQLR